MGKVLIVGCGGVASVAVHKCCQNSKVFDAICIASRTVSKCEALKEKLQASYNGTITTAQVDADNPEELIALIEREKTGRSTESGTSISGSYNYGCLPCDRSGLCRHCKL